MAASLPLTDADAMAEFRAAGALLEGHFVLSSGRHSARYLQCARVLMDGARAERLARALAARLPAGLAVDAVISPAVGGVLVGHEMGRALGVPAMFLERPTGAFELRRGFALAGGERVLVAEDVVTTGLSSGEAIAAVERAGGTVVAACALVDRSGGAARFAVPFAALLTLDVPSWGPDEVPPDLAAIPVARPGSRAA